MNVEMSMNEKYLVMVLNANDGKRSRKIFCNKAKNTEAWGYLLSTLYPEGRCCSKLAQIHKKQMYDFPLISRTCQYNRVKDILIPNNILTHTIWNKLSRVIDQCSYNPRIVTEKYRAENGLEIFHIPNRNQFLTQFSCSIVSVNNVMHSDGERKLAAASPCSFYASDKSIRERASYQTRVANLKVTMEPTKKRRELDEGNGSYIVRLGDILSIFVNAFLRLDIQLEIGPDYQHIESFCFLMSVITFIIHMIGNLILCFNRYSAVCLMEKYDQIWARRNIWILIVSEYLISVVPLLHIIGAETFYIHNPDGSYTSIGFEATIEVGLLIHTFTIFLLSLLMFARQFGKLYSIFAKDTDLLLFFTMQYYWINDIMVSIPPFSLFAFCSDLRRESMKKIRCRRYHSNVVSRMLSSNAREKVWAIARTVS
ncbi:hypothetical protein RB195_003890 [Necator americanus]|uniref:7TM GPCR serpentine receptor class x (Srx) domain-containing protein n=1 Tax=Necator americanus TaxID=51031 RepID=A0ABR1DQP1_NECAM